MPNIRDEINWDDMSPEQLNERRVHFLTLVKQRTEMRDLGQPLPPECEGLGPDDLPLSRDELHEWLETTRQLRKRNSGPKKTPTNGGKRGRTPTDPLAMI